MYHIYFSAETQDDDWTKNCEFPRFLLIPFDWMGELAQIQRLSLHSLYHCLMSRFIPTDNTLKLNKRGQLWNHSQPSSSLIVCSGFCACVCLVHPKFYLYALTCFKGCSIVADMCALIITHWSVSGWWKLLCSADHEVIILRWFERVTHATSGCYSFHHYCDSDRNYTHFCSSAFAYFCCNLV